MNMVNGKCPNCGASIKLDKDKDAGICEYCGTAFVTEKAINNYGTYIDKQVIHNVKEDNEWTYKSKKEDNDKFWGIFTFLVLLLMVGMLWMFHIIMPIS